MAVEERSWCRYVIGGYLHGFGVAYALAMIQFHLVHSFQMVSALVFIGVGALVLLVKRPNTCG